MYLSFFQVSSLQVIKEKLFNWQHLLTSMFMCLHVVYIICLQFWPRTGSRNPFRSSRRQCEISIWGDQRYSFSQSSLLSFIHSCFYLFFHEPFIYTFIHPFIYSWISSILHPSFNHVFFKSIFFILHLIMYSLNQYSSSFI